MYWAWVCFVNPIPEVDGLFQFYNPLLNALEAIDNGSLDLSNLRDFEYSQKYPLGWVLPLFLVKTLGLVDFVVSNPFVFNLILIFPFALIPVIVQKSPKAGLVLGLALLFHPYTQIMYKSFTLHSHNIVFHFLAVILFIKQLRDGFSAGSFGLMVLFLFYSASEKHFGMILGISFVLSYLVWGYFSKKIRHKVLIGLTMSLFLAVGFYRLDHFYDYVIYTFCHSPFFRYPEIGVTALIISFLICMRIVSKANLDMGSKVLSFSDREIFVTLIVLLCIHFFIPLLGLLFVLIPVVGVVFLVRLIKTYDLGSADGFALVNLIIVSTVVYTLYYSEGVYLGHLLFYPSLLITYLWFREPDITKFKIIWLCVCFCLSSFFPSLSMTERSSEYLINFHRYTMQSPVCNYLGWNKCFYKDVLNKFFKAVDEAKFQEGELVLVQNTPWLVEQYFTRVKGTYFKEPNVIPYAEHHPPSNMFFYTDLASLTKAVSDGSIPLVLGETNRVRDDIYIENLKQLEYIDNPISIKQKEGQEVLLNGIRMSRGLAIEILQLRSVDAANKGYLDRYYDKLILHQFDNYKIVLYVLKSQFHNNPENDELQFIE
jgi:hypothetical protein